MKNRLAISLAWPVFVSALVCTGLIYAVALNNAQQRVEKAAFEDANSMATHLQNMLNSQLTLGNLDSARLSFSLSTMHSGVEKLLLNDDRNQVILASRYIWEGQAAAALVQYDAELAKEVRLHVKSRVMLSPQGGKLIGYYPVTLKIIEKELGKKKIGVLYFEYDFAAALIKSKHEAAIMALMTSMLLLIAAAVVIWLLRRLVSDRINKLVQVANQFAQGDLNTRANIVGADEIALLGRTFDQMAEQRGKAEIALRIKDAAIESSLNAIALTDLEGKHTYVNKAFVNLWQLPSAEYAIGLTAKDFSADLAKLKHIFDVVQQVGSWQGETPILRYDGVVIETEAAVHLIADAAGHPVGVMGTFVDVMARKKAEAEAQAQAAQAQLQATIEAIPDLLFDLDLEGTYYDIHAQNVDQLAAPENTLLGKKIVDVLPPAAASVVMSALQEAHLTGRSLGKQFEFNLPTGLFWFELSVARKNTPAGELPRFIVLSRDVTYRMQAIERLKHYNDELEQRVEERTSLLNAAKKEAERSNEAKSVFLSSMSHELRTPLNAILGYAQLMEMTPELSDDMHENAHEIKRAGDLLLALINDIIDLARIESGRMDLQLEQCSLTEILSAVHSQNSRAAEKRNIKLVYDPSCDTAQLMADRRRLLQIFNNLISNAIKYNRDAGTVTVVYAAQQEGIARITVTDTGMGIAAESVPKLFKHFSRLGAEMSEIEGTGIGLVITRHLVEGMGGQVGVESVQGEGSSFWIELPTHGGRVVRKTEPVEFQQANVEKLKVLLADDYPQNQNILRIQLLTLGCEVEVVANGVEALDKYHQKAYDIILTDLNMPQMDGTALAKAIRQEETVSGSRIPIVAVTAAAEPSEIERCRAAGMDDVLTKPISIAGLRGVLERWFSLAEMMLVKEAQDLESTELLDIKQIYSVLGQVDFAQACNLIETFLQTTREELQAMRLHAVEESKVARELHKQKSSAKTAGAMRYAQMAQNLELRIKSGASNNMPASLAALNSALDEVEVAFKQRLATQALDVEMLVPALAVKCASALVVDDDAVVLQQVTSMLRSLGVAEVLVACDGLEALQVIAAHASKIEVMVCDLDMPGMDGVELIREFARSEFAGGIIFMSGADEKVLGTVSKLASLQGLRVLGQLSKPVTPPQMVALLATLSAPVLQKAVFAPFDVSPAAIRQAMLNDEFTIWLQPKVESASLKPVGMEALARWKNAAGRFVPPDIFISVAEQSGLIAELSKILVFKALEEGAKVFEAGFPLKVAINLSGRWLNDLNLPDFVRTKTLAVGLKTEDVMLEVTETGVMEDLTTALDVLTRLRIKGFSLSIDDFGIGYSSLEQLGRIPFNEMKLDRSFVSKASTDSAARAILESSMDMAQKLGLSTVAEGVETEKDLEIIRTLGCERVQGYLIAKPMPLNELLEWLKTNQHL